MSAIISPCGKYRYVLDRLTPLQRDGGRVCWIMLNPSTADASKDDPTIRRVLGFSTRWGFSAMRVVNLFAWRATDPKELHVSGRDLVGPDNDRHIAQAIQSSSAIIAAWGSHGFYHRLRRAQVGALFIHREVDCLGHTRMCEPKHPLMLSYETPRSSYWSPDGCTPVAGLPS